MVRKTVVLWEDDGVITRYDIKPEVDEDTLAENLQKRDRTAVFIRYMGSKGYFAFKPTKLARYQGASVLYTCSRKRNLSAFVRCVVHSESGSTIVVRYVNARRTIGEIFSRSSPVTVGTDDLGPDVEVKPTVMFAELYPYMTIDLPIIDEVLAKRETGVWLPTLSMKGVLLEQRPSGPHFDSNLLLNEPVSTQFETPCSSHPRALVICPGRIGLTNSSGIMCYVNSVTQILSHTPLFYEFFVKSDFEKGINDDNPLGTGGALASKLGELIRSLWQPSYSEATTSHTFWRTVGRFRDCFTEIQQQDAQEFLAAVLDGLHEDYNEVRKRIMVPKFEPPDTMQIEEVAAECWMRHLLRNRSFIVQHCMGQLKSTLQCRTCGKGDLTFDPYMQLSLELPDSEPNQLISWIFYPATFPLTPPIVFQRYLSPFDTLDHLAKETFKSTGRPVDEHALWTTLVFDDSSSSVTVAPFEMPKLGTMKIHHILTELSWSRMSTTRTTKWLALYESGLPKDMDPSTPLVPVVVNSHANVTQQGTLHPIMVIVPQTELSSEYITNEVFKRFQVGEGEGEGLLEIRGGDFNESTRHGCDLCSRRSCEGCRVYPAGTKKVVPTHSQNRIPSRQAQAMLDKMNESQWVHVGPCDARSLREMMSDKFGDSDDYGNEALLELVEDKYQDVIQNNPDIDWWNLTPSELVEKLLDDCIDDYEHPQYFDPETPQYVEFDPLFDTLRKRCGTRFMYCPLIVKVCWCPTQRDKIPEALHFNTRVQADVMIREAMMEGCILNHENTKHFELKREQDTKTYGLEDCLSLFTRVEKLEDGDRWKCPRCKKEEPSRKRFELWSAPNMLFLHIKRFACRDACSLRLRHAVSFPLKDLDLSSYLAKRGQSTISGCQLASPTLSSGEPAASPLSFSLDGPFGQPPQSQSPRAVPTPAPPSDSRYTLQGVVCHHGPDIQFGHYTSHCLHRETGKWFHYNDDSVRETSAEEMLEKVQRDVYLLVYVKNDMTNKDWMEPAMWPNLAAVNERVERENAKQAEDDRREREEREERERRKKEQERTGEEGEPDAKRQRASVGLQGPYPTRHPSSPSPSYPDDFPPTLSDTPQTPVV